MSSIWLSFPCPPHLSSASWITASHNYIGNRYTAPLRCRRCPDIRMIIHTAHSSVRLDSLWRHCGNDLPAQLADSVLSAGKHSNEEFACTGPVGDLSFLHANCPALSRRKPYKVVHCMYMQHFVLLNLALHA